MRRIFRHDRLCVLLAAVFLTVCALHFSSQRVGDALYRVTTLRAPVVSAPATEPEDGEAGPEDARPDSLLPGERIDINTAGAADLARLPQIGASRAQAIIDWREENGGFQTIEDLMQVKGIGEGIFGQVRDYITVDGTGQGENNG